MSWRAASARLILDLNLRWLVIEIVEIAVEIAEIAVEIAEIAVEIFEIAVEISVFHFQRKLPKSMLRIS